LLFHSGRLISRSGRRGNNNRLGDFLDRNFNDRFAHGRFRSIGDRCHGAGIRVHIGGIFLNLSLFADSPSRRFLDRRGIDVLGRLDRGLGGSDLAGGEPLLDRRSQTRTHRAHVRPRLFRIGRRRNLLGLAFPDDVLAVDAQLLGNLMNSLLTQAKLLLRRIAVRLLVLNPG